MTSVIVSKKMFSNIVEKSYHVVIKFSKDTFNGGEQILCKYQHLCIALFRIMVRLALR